MFPSRYRQSYSDPELWIMFPQKPAANPKRDEQLVRREQRLDREMDKARMEQEMQDAEM